VQRQRLIVSAARTSILLKSETLLNIPRCDACVVGIPSEEWGQRVAAAVVLKPEVAATTEELDAFCRQHLAGYKCPRKYVFVDGLPQTASGKVSRQMAAEMLTSA
jgi:acyl-CoA synthetase (AMP-forming)/AMP-acid ligase II